MRPDSLRTSETAESVCGLANDRGVSQEAGVVEAVYFTDPLCPWSWALEPHWRRLRLDCGGRLGWRYVMGGMIADWQSYHDALNAVHNPGQMGAQCYQARQLTGMPFDERIWHDDPPSSSYPACLAVKAAERQGPAAGEAYLRRAREAAMLARRNVARGDVLMELAEEVAEDPSRDFAFDIDQFREDLLGPDAAEAFHDDLRQIAYRKVTRFPTLLLRFEAGPAIAVAGYRPYEVLRRALAQLAPDVGSRHDGMTLMTYFSCWKRATAHEVAWALGVDRHVALRLLEDAVNAGLLAREELLPDGYRIQGT